MNKLIGILEKEDCDVEDALTRCMNMEELYLELLELFVEDDQIDQLMDAFRFFHSHTLKGVYTNLGMKRLYELDVPVVEGTREKRQESLAGLEEDVDALCREHKRIVAVIRECI